MLRGRPSGRRPGNLQHLQPMAASGGRQRVSHNVMASIRRSSERGKRQFHRDECLTPECRRPHDSKVGSRLPFLGILKYLARCPLPPPAETSNPHFFHMDLVTFLLILIAGTVLWHILGKAKMIALFKILAALVVLAILVVIAMEMRDDRAAARAQAESQRLLRQVRIVHDPVGADSAAVFDICNDGRSRLHWVAFGASGFEAGRSTPHRLHRSRPGDPLRFPRPGSSSETRFTSDFIVGPGACTQLIYPGHYSQFDFVGTRVLGVIYADGSSAGLIQDRIR